jgi:heme-degrading monooxygenase HmoA
MVKFKSALSMEELQRRYRERMPDFRSLPGLVQKYYVHDPATDEVGGLYLWDSEESLQAYLASDLRKTIAAVYEVQGQPVVQRLSVLDVLRT